MRLPVSVASAHNAHFKIAPEFDDRETREFWRELARLITFFDLCSPCDVDAIEIGRIS
jgi:hypothetical protein